MAKRNVARKKVAGGKRDARGRKAARPVSKMCPGRTTAPLSPGGHQRGTGVQPRVWRRMARLAEDAQAALAAGRLDRVREYLQSIHAVAVCADQQ